MFERDHILSEIRRTSAENGGKVLGRQRFSGETGIKERDWNQYWPRWSDAVRAAGLEHSNRFNAAIPEETLLEKLVSLVRELGKFPVVGDLRVKARADSAFPAPETFRRFGGMRHLAERVKTFAFQHGYQDVVALCPESAVAPVSVKPSRLVEIGAVYLMKSGRYFKIGHTNAVGRREREIALQLPQKIKVLHEIRTDDPHGIEDYWHRRFAARRANGEWFDLAPDDVATFRRRKTM
jgi:hypothetical protein